MAGKEPTVTHLGLICPEVSGHLNPMTTLGREMQRRGCRVSLIACRDGQRKAEAAGLGYLAIGESDFPAGTTDRVADELGRLSSTEAIQYTVRYLLRLAAIILQEAPQRVREAGVEALLVDQVSSAAGTAAERLDVPYVTICNALALNQEPDVPPFMTTWPYEPTSAGRARNEPGYSALNQIAQPILDALNAQRRQWGLAGFEQVRQGDSPLAQIAQQPACFDFPRKQLPPHFHYTGPFHDDASGDRIPFPYEALTGQPLIYASMGTLQNNQLSTFHTIAAACEGLDAQLVLSLGCRDREVPADLPGSPVVVAYAPQLELLKRAALTITHAGMNTVLESLRHGVPMVAIPITNDQPGVAARMAYLGAGERVELADLKPARLRAAIQQVLTQSRYREAARRVQAEMAQINGVERAADIAEQALSTRRPVLRQ
jgi:zeaxanthin glucosyltransferase